MVLIDGNRCDGRGESLTSADKDELPGQADTKGKE